MILSFQSHNSIQLIINYVASGENSITVTPPPPLSSQMLSQYRNFDRQFHSSRFLNLYSDDKFKKKTYCNEVP